MPVLDCKIWLAHLSSPENGMIKVAFRISKLYNILKKGDMICEQNWRKTVRLITLLLAPHVSCVWYQSYCLDSLILCWKPCCQKNAIYVFFVGRRRVCFSGHLNTLRFTRQLSIYNVAKVMLGEISHIGGLVIQGLAYCAEERELKNCHDSCLTEWGVAGLYSMHFFTNS